MFFRMNTRLAALAALVGAGGGPVIMATPERRPADSWPRRIMSTDWHSRRLHAARVPFSSDRQRARCAARQYTVTLRNGHTVMQTCKRGEQPSDAMKRAARCGLSVSKSFADGVVSSTTEMRDGLRSARGEWRAA
jgi:hypothetical protein